MNLADAVNLGDLLVDAEDLQKYGSWGVSIYLDARNYLRVRITNPEEFPRKYSILARLILNVTDSAIQVDHKNLNTRDCRKDNLRVATATQNRTNQEVRSDNIAGYKGVTKLKKSGRYVAKITTNIGVRYLGSSYDPIVAAKLYDAAAKEYFGEFARLNFPEEPVCENSSAGIMRDWNAGDSSVSSQTQQE